MDRHVNTLGILYVVFGALGLFGAFAILIAFRMTGVFLDVGSVSHWGSHAYGDVDQVVRVLGLLIATAIGITSIPGIIAGIGLINRTEWGRIFALILGAINLINIPFGTALGIYAIWVTTQKDTIRICSGRTPQARTPQATAG